MASNLTSQVRNIAEVTTAVARGDLSRKITVDVRGEILELKNTINTMVEQLNSFASEVTRVAREVGTEGKLGGQADVKGVAGVWKDLTDSVNSMAGNLTAQVRNIADVTTAVARGDLSRKITVDVRGEILALKETINTMVDQLSSFASEVTRVAKEVGTEGKLGGQANVPGVAGTWKDLTDSVNSMASNLTNQVRNIAEVTTAVARGDLSRKITVDVRGEILSLKDTINTMVDQLQSFASEVTRVAREVGTEGKLGGQADVKGVAGVWKDLTESVNSMAGNLTAQVRNIADVTTAVARGDLSRKITVDVTRRNSCAEGNHQYDGGSAVAHSRREVTRVAKEVGTEGKLGGQANVPGVAGTWKDLTDSVNSMASNLTNQVRNIAEVTTAVAAAICRERSPSTCAAKFCRSKTPSTRWWTSLSSFASEVTRVAREVGTEGKLGGQADVKGVAGVWKDLTESRQLDGLEPHGAGPKHRRRDDSRGERRFVAQDHSRRSRRNSRVEEHHQHDGGPASSFASEVTRVAREVGTEGKLGGQADVYGVAGTWKDLTESVNSMASNVPNQVRNIAQVTTAVANGDLSRKITVDVRGEILELKNTINTMVDQLNSFASEVTRVAREVGTEGKLGGQAEVRGVAGTWKDLTDSVNLMAANLTTQVRGIAKVVTAVANGDLKRKLVLEDQGRNRGTGRHHQRDDRHAGNVRRSGDDGCSRGRHRRQTRRSGACAWRCRHLARSHGQRQPACRQSHHPGPSHRRRGERRHKGRPHPIHRGRSARRSRGVEGHDQSDDREPRRNDAKEHRTGLAQDQHRAGSPASCRGSATFWPSRSCCSPKSSRSSAPSMGRSISAMRSKIRPCSSCWPAMRIIRLRHARLLQAGRRTRRPVRLGEEADARNQGSAGILPYHFQHGGRNADHHRCAADPI